MPQKSEKGAKQTVAGEVIELLPNASFKVRLEDDREILAHLSGKMRMYRISVLGGDRVSVEMSEYDKDRGRIIRRL